MTNREQHISSGLLQVRKRTTNKQGTEKKKHRGCAVRANFRLPPALMAFFP